MNQHCPIRSKGSLLERAAEVYDFAAALRGKETPPSVSPPPAVETPPFHAAPAVDAPIQIIDRDALEQAGYLLPDAPVSAVSEEFRIIKRQLLLAATGGRSGAKIPHGERILVCSAHPGEGKTWCAVNLALSMAAEKDVEILLVDADFAKPSVPAIFGLSGSDGLMDALADPAANVENFVIRTDVPTLSVLPAGRQTNADTEYLSSARTEAVLNALTARHPSRIVIFDSPPVLAASPAAALACHVGQAVLIVRADQTTESALRDAVGLLQGCENIQLLLNGAKYSPGGRRFGAYYGQGAA